MRNAYLTIDDSPSPHTDELTDFLVERGVPAILFARGDMIDRYGRDSLIRAVQKGFLIANHTYSHQRASEKSFEDYTDDILRAEKMIEDIYRQSGEARPAKHFRFPYLDRGTGTWVVDFDEVDAQYRDTLKDVFLGTQNSSTEKPSTGLIEKRECIQAWLRREGFTCPDFSGVSFDWYRKTPIAQAVDALSTFTTSDWMLTERHKGNWDYKTIDDLKAKIDNDKMLQDESSANIILAHDAVEIDGVVRDLIDHLLDRDYNFLPVT